MNKRQALHEEIACAAYGLYEKRGREDGQALEDWLEAESQATERHARHAREIAQGVAVFEKPDESGFRQTVKKGGFYKKS